jgi:hypothetical protein
MYPYIAPPRREPIGAIMGLAYRLGHL